jgi:ubiquinone/menaquinone biosynthesis C-methylase UbiE
MSIPYHEGELSIALDPSNPSRAMPPILAKHKRILDVGCGMGQTLLASHLSADVEAYGVDSDPEAVAAGSKIMPQNIKLLHASGESLPFEDCFFDIVFSRVALPYMHIGKALGEISRVLKPGGDLWMILHPISMVGETIKNSLRLGHLKDVLFSGYVLVNGTCFNLFGKQFDAPYVGRQETFQTAKGIANAMQQAGLVLLSATRTKHFIATGQKPLP